MNFETEKARAQLSPCVKALEIGNYERHIFLCFGPDCCALSEGEPTWNHLKKRLKDLGPSVRAFRSKVGCLRVCKSGPIAVVYPEGVWYFGVTVEVCERIISEHLVRGEVVEEFVFARNPLP